MLDLLVFRLSDAPRPFFTTRCEIYSVSTRVTFHEKTDDIVSRVEKIYFARDFREETDYIVTKPHSMLIKFISIVSLVNSYPQSVTDDIILEFHSVTD
jgi:hypothetical protein